MIKSQLRSILILPILFIILIFSLPKIFNSSSIHSYYTSIYELYVKPANTGSFVEGEWHFIYPSDIPNSVYIKIVDSNVYLTTSCNRYLFRNALQETSVDSEIKDMMDSAIKSGMLNKYIPFSWKKSIPDTVQTRLSCNQSQNETVIVTNLTTDSENFNGAIYYSGYTTYGADEILIFEDESGEDSYVMVKDER